jgi:LDH2 family malate/lactate/ureidoglycolate dehydrogenase
MSELVFAAESLHRFVSSLVQALGASPRAAALMADSLVAANLRGVDSHGLQLLPFYATQLEDGRVDKTAEGRLSCESGALAIYDGCNALGQVVAEHCCQIAIRLARHHGLGLVLARESNHFGAAAWWAQRISEQQMLGIVLCNASPVVAPWQGREPRWGTNPICVSVPGRQWLLDMATTTVAMGKIYQAGVNHQPDIPPGWALDADGVPTTSTEAALKGMLMPLGGYKGSGLAMMVEILTGVLSGGAFATDLGGLRVKSRPFRVSQFFLAVDIGRLMPLQEFSERLNRFVAMVKSTAPARGHDEVLVAGEPEWRTEADRLAHGIPVSRNLWLHLSAIADRLGVPMPHPYLRDSSNS